MRRSRTRFAAVLAVVAASTAAPAAGAAEFHATKEGALSAKALNTQVLTAKFGKMECGKLKAAGVVSEGASATQALVVKYESCVFHGFIELTISPAHYLLRANGTVGIEEEIFIEAPGCVIHFPVQEALGVVKYVNNEGALKLEAKVTKLTSYGEGGTCEYASESNGTYNGTSEVEAAGSELSWS